MRGLKIFQAKGDKNGLELNRVQQAVAEALRFLESSLVTYIDESITTINNIVNGLLVEGETVVTGTYDGIAPGVAVAWDIAEGTVETVVVTVTGARTSSASGGASAHVIGFFYRSPGGGANQEGVTNELHSERGGLGVAGVATLVPSGANGQSVVVTGDGANSFFWRVTVRRTIRVL